ncbi:CaiB/BaiF CoA transferase family protein [Roseicella frigidaeris]|uniref:CoA transferase n=1 Tax=Roseicella frigidaeris TaxID=2230885 RepID=A0A327M7W8_9PROT|nr:CoA transferase [Roseicella frigidaeris]RAI58394.1 CoA transferase [Roseicella frigidaeris]
MSEKDPAAGPARLPLAGLRILELGHYIAAPFATRLLADLGAEVIKVEPPEGDPVRGWGSEVGGHAVWFSVHGRNKLSVTLNLKDAGDKAKLRRLVARSDALVENFRPGQLERYGLGPAELHAVNPRLVIARISGYGQDGPYRDKPAFGAIGEAMGGLRHLTANPGQTTLPPPRCGVSISDDLAGMYAAMALVAGCWQVKGDPAARGRIIDVDLVGSVFSLMEGMLPEYGLFGWVRQPQGAAIKTAAPTNTYPCADGKWLCIAGNSDLIFRRLMAAIGRPEAAAEPRFATNALRCENVAELDAMIAAWTRTLPAAEAEAVLETAEVPCSRLYDMRDCAEDPHFRARQMVMPVQDPLIGEVLHPAAPFRLDGVSPREMVRWTGPAAGAHNEQVFEMLAKEEGA